MSSNVNPVLGTVVCSGCGGQATVKQTKRRGNYLYTQCVECGMDQRTGKAVQNEVWHGCTWKAGVDSMQHRPANVTDDFILGSVKDDRVLVDDWQPEEELDEDVETVKPVGRSVKSGSVRALVALGALLVGLTTVLRVMK